MAVFRSFALVIAGWAAFGVGHLLSTKDPLPRLFLLAAARVLP